MVYDTQNYWASGFSPSSIIPNIQKTAFRKMDLFPSSADGRERRTLLGPLEKRAPLNHWTLLLKRFFNDKPLLIVPQDLHHAGNVMSLIVFASCILGSLIS
jgi:hypothetical protein